MPELLLLLDSDVIIEALRGNREVLAGLDAAQKGGWLMAYTPVAKAEIYHGLRPGEERTVEALFASCRSLAITDAVGEQAGRYLAAHRRGRGTQLGDALVAAAARVHHAALFTLNRRHYPMKDVRFHPP